MTGSLLHHQRHYTPLSIKQQRHVCAAQRISQKTPGDMPAVEVSCSPFDPLKRWDHCKPHCRPAHRLRRCASTQNTTELGRRLDFGVDAGLYVPVMFAIAHQWSLTSTLAKTHRTLQVAAASDKTLPLVIGEREC